MGRTADAGRGRDEADASCILLPTNYLLRPAAYDALIPAIISPLSFPFMPPGITPACLAASRQFRPRGGDSCQDTFRRRRHERRIS